MTQTDIIPSVEALEEAASTVTLPVCLTIDTIEAFISELLKRSPASGEELILDASGTEIITTPGIQALISYEKSLTRLDGHMQIRHVRESVANSFRTLGLEGLLDRWSSEHA